MFWKILGMILVLIIAAVLISMSISALMPMCFLFG